jgi:catechol 2,3-dioxygenase-like lactoylglutathione lyase family enzyme
LRLIEGRALLKKIYHLGYAVEDLDAAARFYREYFGAVTGEPEEVEEQGVIATMFDVGESKIELVQPTRPDSPTILKGLKENGVELIDDVPRIGAGGARVAFLHPKGILGVLTELVELPKSKG